MGQALHALGIDSMSIEDRIDLVKDIGIQSPSKRACSPQHRRKGRTGSSSRRR